MKSSALLCIYHSNCSDGYSAAWVVRRKFADTEFYAGVHGGALPDTAGRDVVFVDFSYKRGVIIRMAEKAKSILILDHHKSAHEDLIDLPSNVEVRFNMEKSGCMMAWDYYFPNEEPPQLLKHVEDRDLWRFALPNTREIQATVFSYPYEFEVWDTLMNADLQLLANEGVAIERKHLKDVNELLEVTQRTMVIGGFTVPVANLSYTLVSDAANKMAVGNPFAACYWDISDGRVFGLRSVEGGEDVSKIASEYGGGGHQKSSGFKVPRNHPLAVA